MNRTSLDNIPLITLPPCKSALAREVILAVQRDRESILNIEGLSPMGTDSIYLIKGASKIANRRIKISNKNIKIFQRKNPFTCKQGTKHIYCGESGTAMRFLPALAQALNVRAKFYRHPSASHRPLDESIVDIKNSHFKSKKSKIKSTIYVDAAKSSQFLSAILLTSPALLTHFNKLEIRTSKHPSKWHVALTKKMLRRHGFSVRTILNKTSIKKSKLEIKPKTSAIIIPPDFSHAIPFIFAIAACGGSIKIKHAAKFISSPHGKITQKIARHTKCKLYPTRRDLLVSKKSSTLPKGIPLNLQNHGEIFPYIAALCTTFKSKSSLTKVNHTSHHESNRVLEVQKILNAFGTKVQITKDKFIISPPTSSSHQSRTHSLPSICQTHSPRDHRLTQCKMLLFFISNIKKKSPPHKSLKKSFSLFQSEWTKLPQRHTPC